MVRIYFDLARERIAHHGPFFVAQQVGLPLPPGVPRWSERFGRPRASASTLRNQRKILMTQYAPIGAYQLSH